MIRVDVGRAQQVHDVTSARHRRLANGAVAPPILAFVLVTDSLTACVGRLGVRLDAVLHGAQDIEFDGPLRIGADVAATSEVSAVVDGLTGSEIVVRSELHDSETGRVARLSSTLHCRDRLDPVGTRPPPRRAEAVVGAWQHLSVPVAPDLAVRYAEASGDRNPIHLDPEAARSAGLPGTVVHGACALALVADAVAAGQGRGPVPPVRRLVARFSAPVLPGRRVDVRWAPLGGGAASTVAFGASVDGTRVLRDGRLVFDA